MEQVLWFLPGIVDEVEGEGGVSPVVSAWVCG